VSPTAIILILIAAVAHATWNLFSKQASDAGPTAFIWLMAVTGSLIYAVAVVIVVIVTTPRLTSASWIFLIGTGILQAAYFRFLQGGYQLGDLSLVYPVGRGTGALLAALAGVVLLGERPGPAGITGIGLIVVGVVVLSAPARTRPAAASPAPVPVGAAPPSRTAAAPAPVNPLNLSSDDPAPVPVNPPDLPQDGEPASAPRPRAAKAIVFALVTGTFIASYTVWDKYAVASLHTPALLQGYAAFPVMALVFTPVVLRDRPRLAGVWRDWRRQAIGAAILAPAAYILVLIALGFTAVSAVAPAREVSVLFGVLLGGRLLGERSLARRLCGAAAIVAGIVAIALS
jgi:drug/metabolite transporter (DMT)-like permease